MERFFEQIIENSLNEIYIFDTKTYRFIYLNKAGIQNIGYTIEELRDMTPLDITPSLDAEKFDEILSPLLKNQRKNITFHTEYLRKNGTKYNVMVSLQKMKLEKEIFVAFIYDETALLKEREKFMRMFRDHMAIMLLIEPETGDIIDANRSAEKFYGYSIDKLKTMKIQEINTLDDNQILKKMQQVKRQESGYFRLRHKLSNGDIRDVEVYSCPIDVGDKRVLYSIIHDVSEKMKLLDMLQKAAKMESLGALAAGIAHDFNNLLTGIYGYIGLISEIVSEDKAQKYLMEVEKSIHKAKNLTSRMLTFAKGGAPLKELCDLRSFIKETVNFAISGSNTVAIFDIDENLMNAEIDKHQMGHALNNLVINAIQAMPEGGNLHVSAKNIHFNGDGFSSLLKGDYAEITIKDEGCGIPESALDRIFDPFFTTKPKGYGLGLATTFSIIKKHNGIINVKSEENKGTEFNIYLPATSEKITINETDAHKDKNNKKLRVLVLDDEDMVRNLLCDILSGMGMYATGVATGIEAIDIFIKNKKTDPFDLLIFDLILPGGIGGADTLKEIRKIDSDVTALVTSGYSLDPVLAEPQKYGFNGSIPKPFRTKDIKSIISSFFG